MADEHESPVTEWLDDPTRQRELAIIAKRFPDWDEYQRVSFALLFDLVDAMDFYGGLSGFGDVDDDDLPDALDDEPWRKR